MRFASRPRVNTVRLGVLYLIKDEVLRFLGEPEGEFMAVVPVGRPARSGSGPKKEPVETKVKFPAQGRRVTAKR